MKSNQRSAEHDMEYTDLIEGTFKVIDSKVFTSYATKSMGFLFCGGESE